jgi:hypothetical protein
VFLFPRRLVSPPSVAYDEKTMKVPITVGLNFTTNNFITCLAIGLLAGMQFPTMSAQAEVDFSSDIQPVLNEHCTSCHGGAKQAGKVC